MAAYRAPVIAIIGPAGRNSTGKSTPGFATALNRRFAPDGESIASVLDINRSLGFNGDTHAARQALTRDAALAAMDMAILFDNDRVWALSAPQARVIAAKLDRTNQ